MVEIPTVNMNGDTAQSLVDAHVKAIEAVQAAVEAMRGVCPHGRNYPSTTEATGRVRLTKAYNEHAARVQSLMNVESELLGIATNVQEQGNKLL